DPGAGLVRNRILGMSLVNRMWGFPHPSANGGPTMKRREFLKTVAAVGAGLSGLSSGICGRALAAFGQQTPATPQARTAAVTLRQAAGERMLIGAAVGARSLATAPLASLIAEQFGCL